MKISSQVGQRALPTAAAHLDNTLTQLGSPLNQLRLIGTFPKTANATRSAVDLIVWWAGAMGNSLVLHKPFLDDQDFVARSIRFEAEFQKLDLRYQKSQ